MYLFPKLSKTVASFIVVVNVVVVLRTEDVSFSEVTLRAPSGRQGRTISSKEQIFQINVGNGNLFSQGGAPELGNVDSALEMVPN